MGKHKTNHSYGVLRPLLTTKNLILFTLLILCMLIVYYFGRRSAAIAYDQKLGEVPRGTVTTLSWNPRVFLWRGFLTPEECEHIVKRALPLVTRSLVAGRDGSDVQSDWRTSYGAFITPFRDDPVVKRIEQRIAEWTHIPVENGEVMYFLRYEVGQQYKPHHDYFNDEVYIRDAGNRIASVVMYLGEPEEGGETVFPTSGLTIPVRLGDAVLFWNYKPDGTPDENSLHASKPVIKGTKYALTKWLRMRKF
jgi:prolyl 4-hydroxylase